MNYKEERVKKKLFDKQRKSVKQVGNTRRGEMTGRRFIASHPSEFRSIGLTDLRRKMSRVLDSIKDSMEPLYITRRGKVVAVLMSVKAYMKLEREIRLLRFIACGKPGGGKQGKKRTYRLGDFVAEITEENLHKDIHWGNAK